MKYFLKAADLPLDESLYKSDMDVTEKYQAFSSEILRIALIGIAAIGFFYDKLGAHFLFNKIILISLTVKDMLIASLILLAISSSFSLAHRYYSSDSLAYILSSLRYAKAADNELLDLDRKAHFFTKAEIERKMRNRLFKRCKYYLAISTISLALGGFFLVISISYGLK